MEMGRKFLDHIDYSNEFTVYNNPSPYQRTPLHNAAEKGNVKGVKSLVGNGDDVNCQDEMGVSETC